LQKDMAQLRAILAETQRFNLPLRITEVGSLSNSGLVGTSDVFAAALWTLDACLEVSLPGSLEDEGFTMVRHWVH